METEELSSARLIPITQMMESVIQLALMHLYDDLENRSAASIFRTLKGGGADFTDEEIQIMDEFIDQAHVRVLGLYMLSETHPIVPPEVAQATMTEVHDNYARKAGL